MWKIGFYIRLIKILYDAIKGYFAPSDPFELPEINTPPHEPTPFEPQPLPPPIPEHKPFGHYFWILDNGHGKKTRGKRSPKLKDGSRFYEYEFNRDIVERIIAIIDPLGFRYCDLVDDYEQQGNFLHGRVKRANTTAFLGKRIYLSIHSNAAPTASSKDWCHPNIDGIETWHKYGDLNGSKLADIFQNHLVKATGWVDRGIKSKPNDKGQFYVLRRTKMTAILTENGFYNNQAQCLDLRKDEVRQKIAEAHVAAMMEIEHTKAL